MARKIDISEGLSALTEDELNYLYDRNRITPEEYKAAMEEEVEEDEPVDDDPDDEDDD